MEKYTNNEIIHVKSKNGTEHIEFKKLNDCGVKNAVFLRHGGVSVGLYSSLNLRLQSMDDIQNVYKNMELVEEVLKIDDTKICKAQQAHTDNIIHITYDNMSQFNYKMQNKTEADAYIVSDKGIYTMITTADCVPIIIYDKKHSVVANIHSGWKGTIKQIYLKVLKKLEEEFETNPAEVIVCLGPSIGECCFTSKEKIFKEKFTNIWPNEEEYIYMDEEGAYHIDLKYIIIKDLIKNMVEPSNIYSADICTKCNNDDFYSYRVTIQRKDKDYATFATFVGL